MLNASYYLSVCAAYKLFPFPLLKQSHWLGKSILQRQVWNVLKTETYPIPPRMPLKAAGGRWQWQSYVPQNTRGGGRYLDQRTQVIVTLHCALKRFQRNLLESSLTVLALIPNPSVITDARSIDALPREAVFSARLGNGGFRLQHEVKQNKYSKVCFHDVRLRSPFRRRCPSANTCPPIIIIHRGKGVACASEDDVALSLLEWQLSPFAVWLFLFINKYECSSMAVTPMKKAHHEPVITRCQIMPRCGWQHTGNGKGQNLTLWKLCEPEHIQKYHWISKCKLTLNEEAILAVLNLTILLWCATCPQKHFEAVELPVYFMDPK